MGSSTGHGRDATAHVAVSNVVGESLIASVLSDVNDETDRVLLLAHVALDLPLTSLARQLDMNPKEINARIDRTLAALRADGQLVAKIDGVRRAGNSASYHALIFSLHLQDWFCSNCGNPMLQRGVGRPRRTCSTRCRVRLYRVGGAGWKDKYTVIAS